MSGRDCDRYLSPPWRYSIPMFFTSPVLDRAHFQRYGCEGLHRHRRGDARVSLIIRNLEILEPIIEDGFRFAFDDQLRRRERLAAQLQFRLFQVIQIDVAISSGPYEFAGVEITLLSDHMSQQRVRGDIEWNAQDDVRRPLVKLAGEFTAGDIELKQRVAWLQTHSIQFADVPGADDQAAGIGICADLFDEVANLINHPAVRRPPRPPLRAVNRAELAVLVRPFIPDSHTVVVQIFDV